MGWGKVVCWSTEAAISLKRIKIEEKLLWRTYRKSPTLFRTVSSQTPYGLLFPKLGDSQLPPKTSIAIMSGTGEATVFKFGRNIHSIHLNKSALKFWRKGNVGLSRDCQNFYCYLCLMILQKTNCKTYSVTADACVLFIQ